MEITLGEKIKINGEEVPEYLLKALYENLKMKFKCAYTVRVCNGKCIVSGGTKSSSLT
ncbi:hypothetical protein [Avibacterium endocarditidis]|uniref:hypothetical protein n=1 Tax=Avibacterium endocarditidis TaxID=380674 RepID=UPI0039EE7E6D